MAAVHQFLPTFAPRDAIGTHARHVQRILRAMGLESEIYAEGIAGTGRRHAHPYRAYGRRPATPGTWLLYQLSTGSAVAEFVQARPEPKLVNYHNVTTAALFARWEPHVAAECERGRRQLRELAHHVELGVAVSEFNRRELEAAGYRRTAVAPVLVDLDADGTDADPGVLDDLRRAKEGGGADWLFVGRLVPHKSQHDLVRALAAYRRLYDPRARLHLVGGVGSHAYATTLRRYVAGLGLAGAVRLAGSVSAAALVAHFRAADAFVCLSEHEGFCVPIVEAMRHRVPVVALGAAAVPETVAGAGLVLDAKDPLTVAAAVHRVVTDAALRGRMVAAGAGRAGAFTLERASRRFEEVVAALLVEHGVR